MSTWISVQGYLNLAFADSVRDDPILKWREAGLPNKA